MIFRERRLAAARITCKTVIGDIRNDTVFVEQNWIDPNKRRAHVVETVNTVQDCKK